MGDFSPQWLALRESTDARSRSSRLVERLAGWLLERAGPDGAPIAPLTVLDLGCGTGSNLRFLAPRLAARAIGGQAWIGLDRDADLLAALPHWTALWAAGLGMAVLPSPHQLRIQAPGVDWQIHTRSGDLALGADALPIEPGSLVVASALLDLVSDAWLGGLISACRRLRAPLLLALTYDGRVVMEPEHPLDGRVIDLVNAHQRRDKGFGPALGPAALERLERLADSMGLSLEFSGSDWLLAGPDSRLQLALTQGWAGAALEQDGAAPATGYRGLKSPIGEWLEFRRTEIQAQRSRMRVGHQDALLLPR